MSNTENEDARHGGGVPREELKALVTDWRESEDSFRKDGMVDTAGAIEACADELRQVIKDNKPCNVPGCNEKLGEGTGVWCEEHYKEREKDE